MRRRTTFAPRKHKHKHTQHTHTNTNTRMSAIAARPSNPERPLLLTLPLLSRRGNLGDPVYPCPDPARGPRRRYDLNDSSTSEIRPAEVRTDSTHHCTNLPPPHSRTNSFPTGGYDCGLCALLSSPRLTASPTQKSTQFTTHNAAPPRIRMQT